MDYLRTPDACFTNLPDYPFQPHYVDVQWQGQNTLRMHYLDEGEPDAQVVLMLHGEPSWSYLYRKMVTPVVAAGYRVIAPDLIGFGRSDKPVNPKDYSYQQHMDWLADFIEKLQLTDITLMCQDWGGLLGLRMAAEHPQRFARICAANTFLPTGELPPGDGFEKWKSFSQQVEQFPAAGIIKGATCSTLSREVLAAYDAPFPDERYKVGARVFPLLVPVQVNDPASAANQRAWQVLSTWQKPFLTAFSDSDPVTFGGDRIFQLHIPGSKDQHHVTIKNAGHFLQEDKGKELADVLIRFIQNNPITKRD